MKIKISFGKRVKNPGEPVVSPLEELRREEKRLTRLKRLNNFMPYIVSFTTTVPLGFAMFSSGKEKFLLGISISALAFVQGLKYAQKVSRKTHNQNRKVEELHKNINSCETIDLGYAEVIGSTINKPKTAVNALTSIKI